MNANLFINYYIDKDPNRQKELEACLIKNVENEFLNRIIVVLEEKHKKDLTKSLEKLENTDKVYIIISNVRPTYNYYFRASHQYPDDINIIANTDIVVGRNTVNRLKSWEWGNHCLALTRWDFLDNTMNEHNTKFYNKKDSQDCWIIKGRFKDIPQANFCLGKRGCDNRIAFLLNLYYNVINPSLSIRTFHYHLSEIRNYCTVSNMDVVQPPYKLLTPTKLIG